MTHKCQKCGAPVRPNVDGDLRYYPPRAKKAKRKAKIARVQGRTEHSVIMDAITGHRGIA